MTPINELKIAKKRFTLNFLGLACLTLPHSFGWRGGRSRPSLMAWRAASCSAWSLSAILTSSCWMSLPITWTALGMGGLYTSDNGTIPVFPLFFLKKTRKTSQMQGFFILTEPLKSLEKKGKTSKKQGQSSQRKNKEFQKSKERKDTDLSFWHFPQFYTICIALKVAIFPLKRSVLGENPDLQKYLSDDFSCIVTSFPRAKFVW